MVVHRTPRYRAPWSIQVTTSVRVAAQTGATWCVLLVAVAGCAPSTERTGAEAAPVSPPVSAQTLPGRGAVDPDEFAAAIADPARVTINVHVPYEGDISGTDVSIPFDQITAQADRLPAQRNTPLAVYCRTGRMSAIAAATLTQLGFVDVIELRGGMAAWQSSGRSLVWHWASPRTTR